MYAVIRTGGKQYRVEPGFELLVEKLEVEPGAKYSLDDVLMYSDGTKVEVGRPRLPVSVQCTVVAAEEKGEKLRTIKYRRRHNYKRTYGHRQNYTRLMIDSIQTKGN